MLEDAGVRAYKGRMPELSGQKVYLTTLFGMHAAEARHAAKIRYMRRKNGQVPSMKSYITGDTDTDARIPAGYYGGQTPESNVKQAEITITNINGLAISTDAATEAFDEPLTTAELAALVKPFGIV